MILALIAGCTDPEAGRADGNSDANVDGDAMFDGSAAEGSVGMDSGDAPSPGALGDACDGTRGCAPGLPCVDGFCCEHDCAGPCVTCAGSRPGVCQPIPMGEDPFNECGPVSCSDVPVAHDGADCYGGYDLSEASVTCDGEGSCLGPEELCRTFDPTNVLEHCTDPCRVILRGSCERGTAPVCGVVEGMIAVSTPTIQFEQPGTEVCIESVFEPLSSVNGVELYLSQNDDVTNNTTNYGGRTVSVCARATLADTVPDGLCAYVCARAPAEPEVACPMTGNGEIGTGPPTLVVAYPDGAGDGFALGPAQSVVVSRIPLSTDRIFLCREGTADTLADIAIDHLAIAACDDP